MRTALYMYRLKYICLFYCLDPKEICYFGTSVFGEEGKSERRTTSSVYLENFVTYPRLSLVIFPCPKAPRYVIELIVPQV